MPIHRARTWFLAMLLAGLAMLAAGAVDLVTLPRREGVQLTIYNSEDITMVREHRLLTVLCCGLVGVGMAFVVMSLLGLV